MISAFLALPFRVKLAVGGLAALLAFAVWLVAHERNVGKREERTRVADSVLVVTKPQIVRVETLTVRDEVTVTRLLRRLDTVHVTHRDTIYAAGDTGHAAPLVPLPAAEVATLDSLVPACRALAQDCALFRTIANQRFVAYESKIAANLGVGPTWKDRALWAAIGAGLGVVADRRFVRP